MAKIVIDFELGGEAKIDAVGFKGQACDRATEPFERAFGGAIKKDRKPEFAQAETERERAKA